ncbi:Hypothetical_protein [Hexamita inflata]|uniref:Hypothetical_protein n=1 Tax=Hexamita inflata TaxID=28002 RepID=A0AA86P7S6_9EUKA|nr:Hypothetical protein HINF_LOCUS21214 [Hexamita inflata]
MSSGIASVINFTLNTFSFVNCQLSGSNLLTTLNSGYISSNVMVENQININNFNICIDSTNRFGNNSVAVSVSQNETHQCDMCQTQTIAYGLCVDKLQYGSSVNGQLQCVLPFVFINGKCECVEGYILNQTYCVSIIDAISNMYTIIDNNQIKHLQENIDEIEKHILALDHSIYNNFTETNANLNTNLSILDKYIALNYSQADSNLQRNISKLDGRIINNISISNNTIQTLGYKLSQNLTQVNNSIIYLNKTIMQTHDDIEHILLQQQCNNQPGYQMINGQCVQVSCSFYGQILVAGICICPITGQYVINGVCQQQNYELKISNMQCAQQIFVTTFNINQITNQVISQSFDEFIGSVFVSSTVISNAFINIADQISGYTSVITPLFNTQQSFNYIKVQIGAQQYVQGGSLISKSDRVIINNMNIISKEGTQIMIGGMFKFNIMQQTSQNASICNLMVNLSFNQASQGNITLINEITGAFNINNYQIDGSYETSGTIALVGLSVKTSNMTIIGINFAPKHFNVGNYSSYFLGQVQFSAIKLSTIIIVLGNQTYSQIANSISSSSSKFYQFGGLVVYLENSTFKVNQIISNSYQVYKTQNISYSGILIGETIWRTNNISIRSACIQYSVNSSNIMFYCGVLGYYQGYIVSLSQLNVIMNINQAANIHVLGLYGWLKSKAEIVNVQVSSTVLLNEDNEKTISYNDCISPLIGMQDEGKSLIQNATVFNCTIKSKSEFGGVIAFSFVDLQIMNTTVQNSNFTTYQQISSVLIGVVARSKILIVNCRVINVRNTCPSQLGTVVGSNKVDTNQLNVFDVKDSYSSGTNFVNGAEQINCASFTNVNSVTGC